MGKQASGNIANLGESTPAKSKPTGPAPTTNTSTKFVDLIILILPCLSRSLSLGQEFKPDLFNDRIIQYFFGLSCAMIFDRSMEIRVFIAKD